jgi:hypothetical protein
MPINSYQRIDLFSGKLEFTKNSISSFLDIKLWTNKPNLLVKSYIDFR